MPNKMATMQGCCDCGSIVPPCYICPCLLGDYTIDILVKAEHVRYRDPATPEDEDAFDESMEFLKGLITLEGFGLGSLPLYCTGDWLQGCGAFNTAGISFVNDYCEGPFVGVKEAVPYWHLHMDVPNNRIYLSLEWWGVVCGVPDIPSVWAALRWTYEWPSDSCADVQNLTYTGLVEILPFGESTYVVASDDDLIAYAAGIAGSGTDPRFVADNVDTAPDIFLNREPCDESDLCADEGCGPTASMDIEFDDCQIHATDTSTPGTCGAIAKRLWNIEVWSENPTGDEEALDCPDARRSIYGEGEDQEEIFTTAKMLCGSNYFRVTLHVWDTEDCHDSVASGIQFCCACEDQHGEPCSVPSGSLTATLIDPETCTYELCATAPTGDNQCGQGPGFVEWQLANGGCETEDCDCVDVGTTDCLPTQCGGTLLDGACQEIILTGSTTLRWRVWDAACGCFTEWNEIEISCQTCECCEDPIAEIYVTLSGWVNNGPAGDCEGCESAINQTFRLEGNGCGWLYTTVGNGSPPIICLGEPFRDIHIELYITCDETSVTLDLYVVGGASFTTFQKVVATTGGNPIDCVEEFNGAVGRIANDSIFCTDAGAAASLLIIAA